MKGSNNVMAVANPQLDAAILDARSARTEEQATEAHHRVQQLIAKEACWIRDGRPPIVGLPSGAGSVGGFSYLPLLPSPLF